jgi:hypothetical protein
MSKEQRDEGMDATGDNNSAKARRIIFLNSF